MSALPIKSDTRKSLTPSPDLCVSHAGHLATWFSEARILQPTCLLPWAGHLAAHSPHSAAWWYRSWCTRRSLWSQPESYSWLAPTWRQQKCWRSPPCKWRSQTRQRSPRISGRKTGEAQWRHCRGRVPETWPSLWWPKKRKQLRPWLNRAQQNAYFSLCLILPLVCLYFLIQVEKPVSESW